MTSSPQTDRYTDLERLMGQVLDLPRGERDAFVAALQGENPELGERLRRTLEQLDSAEGVGALFAQMANAGDALDAPPADAMPRHIGPYPVMRLLGEGGMGTVYLVEECAEGVCRQVALKLLHARPRVRDARARFRQERRILGSLRHPSITPLLDWGETDEGTPYYTMEYVDGVPIVDYCRTHALDVDERVALLVRVAAVIAHAHQNLIVHRDIKASNILVRAEDDIKLLDFGIAKLLADMPNVAHTGTAAPMTLEAAAPEQIRGEAATVATDIYQLGVLCFRVLTGRLPYLAPTEDALAWLRAVGEDEPVSLRQALRAPGDNPAWATPAAAARARTRLDADLDAVVRKALSKRPAQRYRSMDAMIDDLRAFLTGRPVRARRATGLYVTSRFIGRHRAACAVALAGVALVAYFTNRLRLERDHAVAAEHVQRSKEEAGNDAMQMMVQLLTSEDALDAQGRIDPDAFLDQWRRRIINDPTPSAEVRIALLGMAARPLQSSGRWAEATQILAERVRLQEAQPNLSPALRVQGFADLANTQSQTGDFATADQTIQRSRAIFDSAPPERSGERLHAARMLGSTLVTLGHNVAAQPYLAEAVDTAESAFGRHSREYAWATWDRARGLSRLLAVDAARSAYADAAAAMSENFGTDHRYVSVVRVEQGRLLAFAGDPIAALQRCDAVLALQRQSQAPGKLAVADAYECRSVALEAQGHFAEALDVGDHAALLYENAEGPRSAWMARIQARLADLAYERGDSARGDALLDRALTIERAALTPDSPVLADAQLTAARQRLATGDDADLGALFTSALAAYGQAYGADAEITARCRAAFARWLMRQKAPARGLAELARAQRAPSGGASILAVARAAETLQALADYDAANSDRRAAAERLRAAANVMEGFYPPDHPRVAMARLRWALAVAATDPAEARALARAALPVLQREHVPASPWIAQAQRLADLAPSMPP